MTDFSAIKSHFDNKGMSYFTFYPKSQKPVEAVIRHLPNSTPAENIYDGLMSLDFDVISVKQMTTNRRSSAEGTTSVNLPLFLITLTRTTKSQDIFTLTSICHFAIKVELFKAQNILTQCYNCQKFGYVWANWKQPPRCMWSGGNHLHKDCPEKENTSSTPTCCDCQLAERETDIHRPLKIIAFNASVRPPLWSGGQSSWLQIRRPGFHSRHYQKKSGSGTGSTKPREYNLGAT
jgi:hypothetical protein